MERFHQRAAADAVYFTQPSLSELDCVSGEQGVTLIELLASLVIAAVILSVVVLTGNYEVKSWTKITADSNLHSTVRYADQKLQGVFQNLADVKLDTAYPTEETTMNGTAVTVGSAVVGKDVNGQTVEVMIQPSTDPLSRDQPAANLLISYTPTGATTPSNTVTVPTSSTSFAGTVFWVTDQLVFTNYMATYTAQSTPVTYKLSVTYLTQGGY